MTADLTERLRLAVRGRGKGYHLSLYWCLWHQYHTINDAAKSVKRMDWRSITRELMREGIRTQRGTELKPETVRRTWFKVKEDIALHGAPERVARATDAPKRSGPEKDTSKPADVDDHPFIKGRINRE